MKTIQRPKSKEPSFGRTFPMAGKRRESSPHDGTTKAIKMYKGTGDTGDWRTQRVQGRDGRFQAVMGEAQPQGLEQLSGPAQATLGRCVNERRLMWQGSAHCFRSCNAWTQTTRAWRRAQLGETWNPRERFLVWGVVQRDAEAGVHGVRQTQMVLSLDSTTPTAARNQKHWCHLGLCWQCHLGGPPQLPVCLWCRSPGDLHAHPSLTSNALCGTETWEERAFSDILRKFFGFEFPCKLPDKNQRQNLSLVLTHQRNTPTFPTESTTWANMVSSELSIILFQYCFPAWCLSLGFSGTWKLIEFSINGNLNFILMYVKRKSKSYKNMKHIMWIEWGDSKCSTNLRLEKSVVEVRRHLGILQGERTRAGKMGVACRTQNPQPSERDTYHHQEDLRQSRTALPASGGKERTGSWTSEEMSGSQ